MPYTAKKTLDLLVAVGCHFLAQVKRNQRKLYECIKLYTALVKPFATCEYKDLGHGREVHRRVELFDNQATLPKGWENTAIPTLALYSNFTL